MTDNEGTTAGGEFNPDGSLNTNNRKADKQAKALAQEMLSPEGTDGSTINLGTGNQVKSIASLQKCEQIKNKYMGLGFKQMSNKQ